jgi:hypothetical protein
VNGLASSNGFINRATQRWVGEEGAFFDFNVQTRQVLIHDTPGAQVNVTDFGVAHLAVRQAHFQARRVNQRMRTFRPQGIHDRGFGVENSVILAVFTVAIAIQNHQYHRFFRNRHCDNLMLKSQNLRNFTTAESIK